MDQQKQTEAFSHELGLLIQRFAREFDLPLPSCIGVLEIHKHALLSTHGKQEEPSTLVSADSADVPRHRRPALGGSTQVVLPTDWKLWEHIPATGHAVIADWGPEAFMRKSLQRESAQGRDVWLVDPAGAKHLPL